MSLGHENESRDREATGYRYVGEALCHAIPRLSLTHGAT